MGEGPPECLPQQKIVGARSPGPGLAEGSTGGMSHHRPGRQTTLHGVKQGLK